MSHKLVFSQKTGKKPRGEGKRFVKGVSGNPKGKPAGQRSYATIYREALLELAKINKTTIEELENLIVKVGFERALSGDHRFYSDMLDRIHGRATQTTVLTGADGKDLIPDADSKKQSDDLIDAFITKSR